MNWVNLYSCPQTDSWFLCFLWLFGAKWLTTKQWPMVDDLPLVELTKHAPQCPTIQDGLLWCGVRRLSSVRTALWRLMVTGNQGKSHEMWVSLILDYHSVEVAESPWPPIFWSWLNWVVDPGAQFGNTQIDDALMAQARCHFRFQFTVCSLDNAEKRVTHGTDVATMDRPLTGVWHWMRQSPNLRIERPQFVEPWWRLLVIFDS